jgi:RNA polymerase sigma-32 factor
MGKPLKRVPLTREQQQLVQDNVKFVYKLARGLPKLGHEADLISEGFVGLCIAATKFDPKRNLKFTTYSSYWIRAMMFSYLLRTHGQTHILSADRKLYFKVLKAQSVLREVDGDDEVTAIANEVGSDTETVGLLLMRVRNHDLMLDASWRMANGDTATIEMPADDPLPEEIVADNEQGTKMKDRLLWALGRLSPRERHIIRAHIMSEKPRTLKELGAYYGGISRERVRQLEVKALEKLRRLVQVALPPPLATTTPMPTSAAAPAATVPQARARRA